jgi:hypothetical protein
MNFPATQTLGGLAGMAAPAATVAPFFPHAALLPRQDSVDVCGFISLPNELRQMQCPGKCTTTDGMFGCNSWFWTTCYNGNDSICKTGSSGDKANCCTNTAMPNCVIATKNVGDDWLTNYACGIDISGTVLALDQTTSKVSSKASSKASSKSVDSSSITSDAPPSSSATSSAASDSSVSDTQSSLSSSVGNPQSTDDSSNDDGTEDKGHANVGAIVGGVIGGLALLALIGFGIWFVRWQKSKETPAEPEDAVQPHAAMSERSAPNSPYPGPPAYPAETPKSEYSTTTTTEIIPTAYKPYEPPQAEELVGSNMAHEADATTQPRHATLAEAPSENNLRHELA